MIIRLKDHEKLLNLEINYHAIFQSWHWLFSTDGFLESDYMNNLMAFLFMMYRKGEEPAMRPYDKKNIFRPFELCHIDYCNVVIVTEYPSITTNSSGLGIGNKILTPPYALTDEMELFRKAVETNLYHGNPHLGFDYSLEEAAENGVLFLNTALTCTAEDNKAHVKYWDKFIAHFLTKFQEATADKVFVFIGDACKYADLIDQTYHHVLTEPIGLDYCIRNKQYWNTNVLEEMNDILSEIDSVYYRNPVL